MSNRIMRAHLALLLATSRGRASLWPLPQAVHARRSLTS
jgi:hypothetical protein